MQKFQVLENGVPPLAAKLALLNTKLLFSLPSCVKVTVVLTVKFSESKLSPSYVTVKISSEIEVAPLYELFSQLTLLTLLKLLTQRHICLLGLHLLL